MYKHITEKDMDDAKALAKIIVTLSAEDKKIVSVYVGALKDKQMLTEQPA